jgi:hypothetical protein
MTQFSHVWTEPDNAYFPPASLNMLSEPIRRPSFNPLPPPPEEDDYKVLDLDAPSRRNDIRPHTWAACASCKAGT